MTSGTTRSGGIDRRGFLGLTVAASGGLAMSGCGLGTGSEEAEEGPGAGTINALFMAQAGYSEGDVRAMTATFEKINPGIKVMPSFVAYEALHDTVVASAAAGTYDVVLMDVIWPAEFGTKKIVADVTGKYPVSWNQGMFTGALQTAEYRDRFYGVPWILDTKYLYVNTRHLAQADVDPETLEAWAGVVDAARVLKRKGVVKYPLIWSWSQAEAIMCDYTQLLGAFGGRFLDSSGEPAFNTGGGVLALEFMQQTLRDGLTNPASTRSIEEDVRKTFSAGDASLALNWTYMYAMSHNPAESKVVGQVAIRRTPAGPSGRRPGVNGSMALGVSAGSKKHEAAWRYVEYLTSQRVQDLYSKSSLPVWKTSYDRPKVQQINPATVAVAKKQLNELILRPAVVGYNAISLRIQAELVEALSNGGRGKPAQRALDDAAKAARSIMARS